MKQLQELIEKEIPFVSTNLTDGKLSVSIRWVTTPTTEFTISEFLDEVTNKKYYEIIADGKNLFYQTDQEVNYQAPLGAWLGSYSKGATSHHPVYG